MRIVSLLFFGYTIASASISYAAVPYGMAGCGLGSLVFGPTNLQTSAATTNESFSNQGFGITFGTSNCVGGGSEKLVGDIQFQFLTDNFSTLAKEMAQGGGETLAAFSTMFGCSDVAYPEFAATMQSSYSEIYSAPGMGASFEVITSELKSRPSLIQQCKNII